MVNNDYCKASIILPYCILIFSEWWKNNIYKNIEFCYSCVHTEGCLGKQTFKLPGAKNVPEWHTLANLLGREYSAML